MTDPKTFFQSRTVWANVVGLLALIAAARGVEFGADDANRLAEACLQVVTAASLVASTFFRVIATQPIGPPEA
jgi:predicted P-loop ATPase/GTPase